MRVAFSVALLLAVPFAVPLAGPLGGQDEGPVEEPGVPARVRAIAELSSEEERQRELDALWRELDGENQIPWRSGETAVFLYRGSAESVAVAGDHVRWNPAKAPLARVEPLDLWMREDTFPADARLDYKFVIDGDDWILDPANEAQQWSGYGPNSELAMPDYEPSVWIVPRESVARGKTGRASRFTSEHLDREVVYRVHEPATEHRGEAPLAVLFVTDGHEYLDPRLGALAIVHDNLLAAGRIRPILLVFVDPRSDGVNLRAKELAADPRLGHALTEELLPLLEKQYELTEDASERGILGTSLGGVAAAHVSARHRDSIGLAIIQSPALWVLPKALADVFEDDRTLPARAFVSWGTVHDGAEEARGLAALYAAREVPTISIERHEGHSWGQWSALLDDALTAVFPPRAD